MSAFCMKILTILCLCCTRLSSSESNAVVWRDIGGSVTIQCRSKTDQDCLTLKKGLNDFEVFYQYRDSDSQRVADDFKSRLQFHGKFPNFDILIKNLTSADMGPYWCEYQKVEPPKQIFQRDQGSILLVVRDESKQCDSSSKNLVLVSVGISAAVLVCIIIAVSMWMLKTRHQRASVKPQRINNNDVYEDMRGTMRR